MNIKDIHRVILSLIPVPQSPRLDNGIIELSKISINEDYREKWNVSERDFVCITKKGELIRPTLYRVGGFGADIKKNYFMLLKHVEAFYEDKITKVQKDKPHLESRWVILDKNGIEKVEFKQFDSPYLVSDSCIYSIKNSYHNIETGEMYCESYSAMSSADYLFLNNEYGKDTSKRGVMKINKKDGSWELFKKI